MKPLFDDRFLEKAARPADAKTSSRIDRGWAGALMDDTIRENVLHVVPAEAWVGIFITERFWENIND